MAALFLDWAGRSGVPDPEILIPAHARILFVSSLPAAIDFIQTDGDFRGVRFTAPFPQLVPGEYDVKYPELFVSVGPTDGCGLGHGRIIVYQAQYNSSGTLTAFAADFEGHCTSFTEFDEFEPQIYVAGAVRFNSSRTTLLPFDGAYPRYRLTIAPSPYGRVVGSEIDCGPSTTDCSQDFATVISAEVQAIPAAGYRFAGWTDDRGRCLHDREHESVAPL